MTDSIVTTDFWSEKPFQEVNWYHEATPGQILSVYITTFSRLGFSILSTAINIAVLIMQIKQKMFLKTQYVFGITLTIAQMFFAVSLLLETFGYLFKLRPIPLAFPSLTITSGVLSNFSMIAVAVDRYLALYAIPFKYKQIITIKMYGLIAVGITIVSIATGFTLMYGLSDDFHDPPVALVSLAVPMVMMTITAAIYVIVGYYLAKSHKRLELNAETKLRRIRQTRKIIFTFAAMLVSDAVLLLPLRMYTFYLWFQYRHTTLEYNTFKTVIISNVLYDIFAVNYLVNPIIYWRQLIGNILPALRRTVKKKEPPKSTASVSTLQFRLPEIKSKIS